MKKILVPCDFSQPAIHAFKLAIDIASATMGEVYVLHVIDFPIVYEPAFGAMPYSYHPQLMQDLETEARNKYEKIKNKYAELVVPVGLHIANGAVTPMIRSYIEGLKADLVVMGTHGISVAQGFFIGSNAERIVRVSAVPVFTVKKAVNIDKVKAIVFPTTLDPDQSRLVAEVKALQKFFNAHLHILTINTSSHFMSDRETREAQQEYERYHEFTNATFVSRNNNSVEDGILDYADEVKADLVAMATHGRRGLAHLFNGSLSEDVVNRAEYPTWTCSIKQKDRSNKSDAEVNEREKEGLMI